MHSASCYVPIRGHTYSLNWHADITAELEDFHQAIWWRTYIIYFILIVRDILSMRSLLGNCNYNEKPDFNTSVQICTWSYSCIEGWPQYWRKLWRRCDMSSWPMISEALVPSAVLIEILQSCCRLRGLSAWEERVWISQVSIIQKQKKTWSTLEQCLTNFHKMRGRCKQEMLA